MSSIFETYRGTIHWMCQMSCCRWMKNHFPLCEYVLRDLSRNVFIEWVSWISADEQKSLNIVWVWASRLIADILIEWVRWYFAIDIQGLQYWPLCFSYPPTCRRSVKRISGSGTGALRDVPTPPRGWARNKIRLRASLRLCPSRGNGILSDRG